MPPNKVYIGTSGWSYEHWRGRFYPESLHPSHWLTYYSSKFTTVEINVSFYHLPTIQSLYKWMESSPNRFIFSVKASRYITHMKKLSNPSDPVKKFIERAEVLGHKLGPILFQLPPQWHRNTERLSAFLKTLPPGHRYVFEFRDSTWFDKSIIDLLMDQNIALCLYDLDGTESPIYSTADFVYIRLHGAGEKYDESYPKSILSKWTERIEQWLHEGRDVYCYFNNDFKAQSPSNAMLLSDMMKSSKQLIVDR